MQVNRCATGVSPGQHYDPRMALDEKLLKFPYATAARKRAEAGGKVFIWRALVKATQKTELVDLADTIEAVEHFGWRLEWVRPDRQDSPLQAAWLLMFRRVEA
jgi:hypothetical protein